MLWLNFKGTFVWTGRLQCRFANTGAGVAWSGGGLAPLRAFGILAGGEPDIHDVKELCSRTFERFAAGKGGYGAGAG
jgi:hypothetical protein